MEAYVHDYPTRVMVSSRSDPNSWYLVDLCEHKVGEEFNGSCQCGHFLLGEGKRPSLKKQLEAPGNTAIHRCAHIRYAREHALEILLPVLAAADPNHHESLQT